MGGLPKLYHRGIFARKRSPGVRIIFGSLQFFISNVKRDIYIFFGVPISAGSGYKTIWELFFSKY